MTGIRWMGRPAAAIVLGAALAAAATGQATAQEHSPRTTVGWGVTLFSFSPFVEGLGEDGAGEVRLDNGVGARLYAHHWIAPWLGLQVDGGYARPDVVIPGQTARTDLWTVSGGATLRPLGHPRPVAPYLMGGVGLVSYGLGGPALRLEDDLILDTGRTEQLMSQVGGGVDVALFEMADHHVLGLRVEAANMYVFGRPFRVADTSDPGGHGHWRITVGLHTSLPRY
jgi:hypothetical protein